MLFTIFTSALFTVWVLFCLLVYGYYYVVEVYLDAPFSEQTPSSAHTNLKFLIEKVLHEAAHLPNIRKTGDNATTAVEKERTYEELLATAILNKIISKQEHDLPSSSETDDPFDSNRRNKEYFFGDKSRSSNLESSSISSLDEYLHSDSSLGSTKYVDRVSLTIQQRIEEVLPTEMEDVENDFQHLHDTNSYLSESDPSNWYLQKRQFYGTNSPVPVPMLVPNPLTSAKVLIGDKDIDETSDLSDVISDYDDAESTAETQDLAINSRIIFSNTMLADRSHNNSISEHQIHFGSGIWDDGENVSSEENVNNIIKPKSDIRLDDENVEDVSLISSSSNAEKDAEYSEKYASLPKAVFRSASPSIRFGRDYYTKQASVPSGKAKSDENENFVPADGHSVQEETDLYRAVPVSTNGRNTEFTSEFTETQNSVNITTEWNKEDPNISEITNDSNSSLVNYYDVINSKIYYQSSDNDKKGYEIKVNKKEALHFDSDDFTHQPIEPDINDNEYIITNTNVPKIEIVKHDNEQITDKGNKNEPIHKPLISKITITNVVTDNKPIPVARKKYEVKQTSNDAVGGTNQTNNDLIIPLKINKRLDNTLIKKIYSNPVVRSFALTNREHIPYEIEQENSKATVELSKNSQERQYTTSYTVNNAINKSVAKAKNTEETPLENNTDKTPLVNNTEETPPRNNIEEMPLGNNGFSLEFSDNGSLKEQQSVYNDSDFIELKEKRLVASVLGQFSKSFPNLSKKELTRQRPKNIVHKNVDEPLKEDKNFDDSLPLENYISVKDLRKLFEKTDVPRHQKKKPVHSLTARSISKEMKQKLKSYNGDTYEDSEPTNDDVIGN